MNAQDPKKLIIDTLRKHPKGLTILTISKLTGLHRHTASKYIHELIGAGVLYQREIGPAKLCYVKIKDDEAEERLLTRLDSMVTRKSTSGMSTHLKVFLVLAFSLLILWQVQTFADNISNFLNGSNLSEPVENVVLIDQTYVPQNTDYINRSFMAMLSENLSSQPPDPSQNITSDEIID